MKKTQHISGFTLVELLVVIAIIVLLIGILMPSIHAIRNAAKKSATRARIALIEAAIRAYQNEDFNKDGKIDVNDLPPDDVDYVQLLTGYKSDDDKSGFGFRLVKRGKVYGPYGGADQVPISDSDPPRFLDSWGKEMDYDVDQSQYAPGYKITSGGADEDISKPFDNVDNLYSE